MAPKTVWIKPKITTTDEDQMGKATEALRKQMVDTPRESGTADDARLFHERLCKAMADPKCQGAAKQITQQQNKIMLGVLHVAESDNVYATTSSKSDIPLIKAICAELGFIFAPCVNVQPGKKLRTRGGSEVTQITAKDLSACAAPKLIHAAIKNSEYPCAMTEVWFDPDRVHGMYPDEHTIESCDECRKTIPFLLCPE